MDKYTEYSKESAGVAHEIFHHPTLTRVIELNCMNLKKFRTDCISVRDMLKNETSDLTVSLSS